MGKTGTRAIDAGILVRGTGALRGGRNSAGARRTDSGILHATRDGGDATYGLVETAAVRILRETGRGDGARSRVDQLLARLRAGRAAVGSRCSTESGRYDDWMRHASPAANEGPKDEAVDALRDAMRCGDLPPAFLPQLPWLRSLDGYTPYEELKRERERRIELIRKELIRIETESGLASAS